MTRACLLAATYLGVLAGMGIPEARADEAPPTVEELVETVKQLRDHVREQDHRIASLEAAQSVDARRKRYREELEQVVEEILADKDVGAEVPGWLENLTFHADLRLRYEYRRRTRENPGEGDDGRGRYRLRFGFRKAWPKEDLVVGFRVATGSNDDPTSTNQTFEDMFEEHEIGIDRAWAKWTPRAVPGLTLVGGKMAQPWQTHANVWDSDVNPSGVWLRYDVPGLGDLKPHVGAGAFQLTYDAGDIPETTLAAYAVGWNLPLCENVTWDADVNFFVFSHIDDVALPRVAAFTASPRGNTVIGGRLAAEEFEIFQLHNAVGFRVGPLPLAWFFDWARNLDSQAPGGQDDAYATGLKLGKNKAKGDWSVLYEYRIVEPDAVLGFFSDSDFGYANLRGNVVAATVNLTDACTGRVSLFLTEPIVAPDSETRTTVQADLLWKF